MDTSQILTSNAFLSLTLLKIDKDARRTASTFYTIEAGKVTNEEAWLSLPSITVQLTSYIELQLMKYSISEMMSCAHWLCGAKQLIKRSHEEHDGQSLFKSSYPCQLQMQHIRGEWMDTREQREIVRNWRSQREILKWRDDKQRRQLYSFFLCTAVLFLFLTWYKNSSDSPNSSRLSEFFANVSLQRW